MSELTNIPDLDCDQTQREGSELNKWIEGCVEQPRPSGDKTDGKKDAARYHRKFCSRPHHAKIHHDAILPSTPESKWVQASSESEPAAVNPCGHLTCVRTAKINHTDSGIISIKVVKFAT